MGSERIPDYDAVAKLSRANWEQLCAGLCVNIYAAERSEDRFGRGNGLDAWRVNATRTGIEGWQFRRLNSRLGATQVDELEKNIDLAMKQCLEAFKLPLVKFTAVLNIDPQPPHGRSQGEDQRLASLKKWAATKSVEFEFKGLIWVHTGLLKYPELRPELFEDILSAVADAKAQIIAELHRTNTNSSQNMDSLLRLIDENTNLKAEVQKQVRRFAEEAKRHFDRGDKLQSGEEYSKAAVCLDDALRLIEFAQARALQAKIL